MMRKFFLSIMLSSLSGSWSFAGEALLEYQIKAVCVLNAARFVSWPTAAFGSADSPLVVGILGDNPFGSSLEDVVRGETVQQRQIVVRQVSLKEAATVQVLFISRSERDHIGRILQALDDSSVLTISEIERFTESGGMLGLAVVNGKIRFEINADAARRAQLKISSQFLLLARNAR
jgi:hypothetical protein